MQGVKCATVQASDSQALAIVPRHLQRGPISQREAAHSLFPFAFAETSILMQSKQPPLCSAGSPKSQWEGSPLPTGPPEPSPSALLAGTSGIPDGRG